MQGRQKNDAVVVQYPAGDHLGDLSVEQGTPDADY
jgi:hypothetical protein